MTSISKQTPLLVAPANPAGRELAKQLSALGYHVVGFVDNLKQAEDIVNAVNNLPAGSQIVLHQASYTSEVAAGLLDKGFAKSSLVISEKQSGNEDVVFSRYQVPLAHYVKRFKFTLLLTLFTFVRCFTPKKHYLYYAEGFFDTNMLLAYREHKRSHSGEVFLVGRNLKQHIAALENDADLYKTLSIPALLRLCCTRRIVVDHEFTGQTFSLLRKAIPVVQLWHGLPYKALSGNIHYPHICDEAFISSSRWFNLHIFPTIFRAKQYLDLGYPRNDVFCQTPEQRDWINAEPLDTLNQVRSRHGDIVVYAPTYRDWGDNEYPLDLDKINRWCEQNRVAFILKFHPFISRLFGEAMGLSEQNCLQALPDHPNIYIYPSGKNVYPWLADAAALVTDYSSIAYDFLLADKPIVYFQYDKQQYLQLRGNTLVSDDDFVAGETVTTVESLLVALRSEKELYAAQREKLRNKFETTPQLASPQIVSLVRE
ncbi:CDP-glycerol glycerophosphotransferase family protein [Alteromonas confluentis]|uniref:Uncharacterized protein n=1 Tax=Alteromonas confluentis TaxID=1656094 RepID=A0A1E7Z644_9ALTE|nr:CDP-glycerol glycerophosphotransferase family protein [Alteromonas confluentis]OFC68947.1 hypothetical protein BFC18_19580 [Alteromonas confluentis]